MYRKQKQLNTVNSEQERIESELLESEQERLYRKQKLLNSEHRRGGLQCREQKPMNSE